MHNFRIKIIDHDHPTKTGRPKITYLPYYRLGQAIRYAKLKNINCIFEGKINDSWYELKVDKE